MLADGRSRVANEGHTLCCARRAVGMQAARQQWRYLLTDCPNMQRQQATGR